MTTGELSAAVALAPWTGLLPAHRLDGDEQPTGEPVCLEAMDLGGGHWLAVVADADGATYPVPLVVDGPAVRRARPGDGAAEALLAVLAAGTRRSGGFELVSWHDEPVTGEHGIEVDQTNESIVVGAAAVLKWTTQLADSPAPAVVSALREAGFAGMPRPWGLVRWHPPAGPPLLVASVVAYLPGAVDGWTWALDDLRADVAAGGGTRLVDAAATVGGLVADLHAALGTRTTLATMADAVRWAAEAEADLTTALAVTTGPAHELLERHARAIRAALSTVALQAGAPLLTVHGDLHVGQVLRAGPPDHPTYVVTDFDGSPVVPADERNRPQSAAVDVAGMAQSLAHVGLVLTRHEPDSDPAVVTALTDDAVASFLQAYVAGLERHGRSSLFEPTLVRAFRLRQVCREFTYAATHLPRWSYVPEAALPALVQQGDPR